MAPPAKQIVIRFLGLLLGQLFGLRKFTHTHKTYDRVGCMYV